MSLFVVDQERCKKDGICVAECPMRIIFLKNKKSVPVPAAQAEELCIECGHCVAVCPHGAFSHKSMRPDQCPPVKKEWLLSPERVEHFLRSRRSIRSYKDKPVDRETISRLIHIARYAPSGHNTQPVRWLVIYDSAKVRELAGMVIDWMRHLHKEKNELAALLHMDRVIKGWDAGLDPVCRGAPHVIIAHGGENDRPAPAACIIAMASLELAAPSLGLGACWAGYFNSASTLWPPMKRALRLPEGHISFGAMMIGYPKFAYHRLPLRNEPRITWR